MSFQLVDQILSVQPGVQARGVYQPRSPDGNLALGLIVEAIGQLASWATMPTLDFDHRPVAASAGLVEVLQAPSPGTPIDLEVEISATRRQAISYQGTASCDGVACISLQRAIGPLLAMEEFDDKARVQNLFTTLCADGLPPLPTVQPIDYQPATEIGPVEPGKGFSGSLQLPTDSLIYADHFPRQPVFPATLLLQLQFDQARKAYARPDGSLPEIRKVSGVKIRAFSGPGERLSFRAIEQPGDDHGRQLRLESWRDETRVSAATLYLLA